MSREMFRVGSTFKFPEGEQTKKHHRTVQLVSCQVGVPDRWCNEYRSREQVDARTRPEMTEWASTPSVASDQVPGCTSRNPV